MNMFMSSSMSVVVMSKTLSLGDCGMNTTSLSSSGCRCGCGCGGVRGELAVAATKACCSLSPFSVLWLGFFFFFFFKPWLGVYNW